MNNRFSLPTIMLALGAMMPVVGTAAAQADSSSVRSAGVVRMAWGDPDLRGTYIRTPGLDSTTCGALAMEAIPSVYSGVTQIQQSSAYIIIQNQFERRSRIIPIGEPRNHKASFNSSEGEHGRWESDTFVVESGAGIVERFAPLDENTLEYQVVVQTRTGEGVWTINLPLRRTLARGFHEHRNGCSYATPSR